MEKYILSTGFSRTAKLWKRIEVTWDELKERLRNTQRTSETQGEYSNMTKTQQDNIKDVGGFVGGALKGGRRKADCVESRSIITLDADFASHDFADNLRLFLDCSWIIYSTHKHTPEKPRLRLLIPLNRPVSSDEYEAIARRVAADIGIDMFDDTTYQAHRLMYWPSTSQDGAYVFDFEDGDPLDADAVLARYANWKDVYSWPSSSRTTVQREKSVKKQEDPTKKQGVIGAFCRAYSVDDAISEFLPEIYVPCGMDGRYTYSPGTSSAGAIVYDDGKFLFSNHATDPASGRLCNAFDLVRIHKYEQLDEDCDEKTPVNKRPSYLKMQELAAADKKVKLLIQHEREKSLKEDFEGEIEDDSWKAEIDYDKRGKALPTIENAYIILRKDSELKGRLRLNEFTQREMVTGELPWDSRKELRNWTDTDDAGLRLFFEQKYAFKGAKSIDDAWSLIMHENSFHPVREYLDSLIWDKRERLDKFFIEYLGADEDEYTKAVTRLSLIGAVKRIYEPGCKLDTSLVLVGPQGCGKSWTIKKLGKEWASDTLTTVQGKEAFEQIQGYWIIEMAELASFRKAEIETIKHFISKQEDVYRPAYGRFVINHKRQCVFFGTTNTYDFLKDNTGNRRFYPLDCHPQQVKKDVWEELTEEETDQLWAEAVHRYKAGEKTYVNQKELEAQIKAQQEAHREVSPLEGMIIEFLQKKLPANWRELSLSERRFHIQMYDEIEDKEALVPRDRICVAEIWCEMLNGDLQSLNRIKSLEISSVLNAIPNLERVKSNMRFDAVYGTQKGFRVKNS